MKKVIELLEKLMIASEKYISGAKKRA